MAHEASDRVHAIGITLIRLVITHRRLLEWETSAANAARSGAAQLREFLKRMIASPLLATATVAVVAVLRPDALAVAAPVLALWLAAPWVAFALSRPMPTRRAPLTAADREYLLDVGRKTWAYFEAFGGTDDHHLPPDNVQIGSALAIAHRTSPTNIGLGLLATLAAHDLGFIDTPELVRRVDATLTTIERLPRFEGHLLNWYNTRDPRTAPPRMSRRWTAAIWLARC